MNFNTSTLQIVTLKLKWYINISEANLSFMFIQNKITTCFGKNIRQSFQVEMLMHSNIFSYFLIAVYLSIAICRLFQIIEFLFQLIFKFDLPLYKWIIFIFYILCSTYWSPNFLSQRTWIELIGLCPKVDIFNKLEKMSAYQVREGNKHSFHHKSCLTSSFLCCHDHLMVCHIL